MYITDDGVNPRNSEILTDEIVKTTREAAEKIKNDEIVLNIPLQEDYMKQK